MGALCVLLLGLGWKGSSEFQLTVFTLSCFVGYMVIWERHAALHTPLMSVTNAISGIIVIGGMLFVRRPTLVGGHRHLHRHHQRMRAAFSSPAAC